MSYLSILVLFLAFITFTTNIAIEWDPRNEIYESAPPNELINPPTIIVPKKPALPNGLVNPPTIIPKKPAPPNSIPQNPPFTPLPPHKWPGPPHYCSPSLPPGYYSNCREDGN